MDHPAVLSEVTKDTIVDNCLKEHKKARNKNWDDVSPVPSEKRSAQKNDGKENATKSP